MKILCLKISFLIINFLLIVPLVLSQDIVEQFRQLNGNEWQIALGPWDYIILAQRNIPEIVGENLMEYEARQIADNFFTKNAAFFGVESFTFGRASFIWTESEEFWMFSYTAETFEGEIPPQILFYRR